MAFRSRCNRQLIRATSTVLSVTLVLLLTPCCKVMAGSHHAAAPVSGGAPPDGHGDCNAPSPDGVCGLQLKQAFVPVVDAGLPTGASGLHAVLPSRQFSTHLSHRVGIVPRAGAPPLSRVIDLRSSRLLL